MKAVRIDSSTMPPFTCPVCARRSDAVTGASTDLSGPARPMVGEALICAYCGTILILTELGPRIATSVECQALNPLAKAFVAQFKKKQPQ